MEVSWPCTHVRNAALSSASWIEGASAVAAGWLLPSPFVAVVEGALAAAAAEKVLALLVAVLIPLIAVDPLNSESLPKAGADREAVEGAPRDLPNAEPAGGAVEVEVAAGAPKEKPENGFGCPASPAWRRFALAILR